MALPQSNGREAVLLEAAEYGQTQRAKRLIASGKIDVDFVGPDGRTALHFAASEGHEELVEALIHANCDVDFSSSIYGTALCLAALKGRSKIVKMLLDAGADVNAPGGHLGSVLHASCEGGNWEIYRSLLERGAAVDSIRLVDVCVTSRMRDGNCDMSYLPAGMQYHYFRCQPIARAAAHGRLEMVRDLLDRGVPLEAVHDVWFCSSKDASFDSAEPGVRAFQFTTLGIACSSCHAEIVEELISRRGADPNASALSSPVYAKPLMSAVASKKNKPAKLRCITLLLDAGADINATMNKGARALSFAVWGNEEDAVSLLLQRGAKTTPEILVSALGNPQRTPVLQKLLELGADANGKISPPQNSAVSVYPLHVAIHHKQRDHAKLLLRHGANLKLLSRGWRNKLRDLVGDEDVPELRSLGKQIEGQMTGGFEALKGLFHKKRVKGPSGSGEGSAPTLKDKGVQGLEKGVVSTECEDEVDEVDGGNDFDGITLSGDDDLSDQLCIILR